MKAKLCCLITLVLFMAVVGAAGVAAQSESNEKMVKFYENCITKKIYNCNAKTVLKTSRSVNLRQKADLSKRQVIFFTSNKNRLINEMIEQDIGQKDYKVERYLNKRFYEVSR